MRIFLSLLFAQIALSGSLFGLDGRIETPGGEPVEHARVELLDSDLVLWSDRFGSFTLPEIELPLTILVTHPRFSPQALTLASLPKGPISMVLEEKGAHYEEIVVSERAGEGTPVPGSLSSVSFKPAEQVAAPSTLVEALVQVPGVSENGQAGIFQVVSIRGISRQRVLTLFDGMRLTSERRAGVSGSFLDPTLIGTVDVLRGPSSSFYGSGALGGIVQSFPRQEESFRAETGWDSRGDEVFGAAGWGDGRNSLGLAYRKADDGQAADGSTLNSHFEQFSGDFLTSWDLEEGRLELMLAGSRGDDLGKSSTDFPERTTNYASEEHTLVRVAQVGAPSGWHIWGHLSELETEVLRDDLLNTVDNEASDFGGGWNREFAHSRVGIDLFGRRGVTSIETDPEGQEQRTLDDGLEDEVAVFGSRSFSVGRVAVEAGARLSWHRQNNRGSDEVTESSVNAYLGVVYPLQQGIELTANVGTGERMPSLSERFFSGTTGRGQVLGNPHLDQERSLSLDLGLRWYGSKSYLGFFLSRNEIDDYIERVSISSDLRTFVNLTSGTVLGLEFEGFHRPIEAWQIRWGGHIYDGEAEDGSDLADIPPARLQLGTGYEEQAWKAEAQWEYRFEKDDPGSGELAIPDAHLVSAALRWRFHQDFEVSLRARNLLDEQYFPSADDKAPMAPGRSFSLGVAWELDGS